MRFAKIFDVLLCVTSGFYCIAFGAHDLDAGHHTAAIVLLIAGISLLGMSGGKHDRERAKSQAHLYGNAP